MARAARMPRVARMARGEPRIQPRHPPRPHPQRQQQQQRRKPPSTKPPPPLSPLGSPKSTSACKTSTPTAPKHAPPRSSPVYPSRPKCRPSPPRSSQVVGVCALPSPAPSSLNPTCSSSMSLPTISTCTPSSGSKTTSSDGPKLCWSSPMRANSSTPSPPTSSTSRPAKSSPIAATTTCSKRPWPSGCGMPRRRRRPQKRNGNTCSRSSTASASTRSARPWCRVESRRWNEWQRWRF
mmetsp:Transcript_9139/g.17184  ORF Transcript_9139/g.17184 Transcript_9139/m.17184 type:complete len:237 (-) Transcript_9139:800-1510(-)